MNLKRWCVVDRHHILAQGATRAEVHPKWRRHRDLAKPGTKLHVQIVRCERVGKRTFPGALEVTTRTERVHGRNITVRTEGGHPHEGTPHHPKFCHNCGHAL